MQNGRRRPPDGARTPAVAFADLPAETQDIHHAKHKRESDDEPEAATERIGPDESPARAAAGDRRQQEPDKGLTEHERAEGDIASRTRAKIRQTSNRGTEREDAVGREQEASGNNGARKTRPVPVGAEEASDGRARRRDKQDLDELERERRRVAHEEDDEPRIYVFAGRGLRMADSLVTKQSCLA
ncbi:hypothetical protein GN958_ATG07669 [Phytophthora infestans]|uniref:Uncharacterized protein n=1 Tax=Phytophthora infestans TaxID=4787 RepID=A0A8S9UVV5_PHYIN|nr:hypothetical protein GN958_ATG07669 [Phytophthora infestans]